MYKAYKSLKKIIRNQGLLKPGPELWLVFRYLYKMVTQNIVRMNDGKNRFVTALDLSKSLKQIK